MADNVKKTIKTLTAEEKTAILARAEKIDPRRVAAEFGTSWQAVVALMHSKDKGAGDVSKEKVKGVRTRRIKTKNISAKSEKNDAAAVSASKKAQEDFSSMPFKKSADFTMEERLAVIARVNEIGLTKAAKEAHVNKYTITGWQRTLKKHADAKTTATNASTAAASATNADVPEEKHTTERKIRNNTSSSYSHSSSSVSLEVENIILKEKVSALTKQVEKLRAAIGDLA